MAYSAEEKKQVIYELAGQRSQEPLTKEQVEQIQEHWYPYSPQDVLMLRLVATCVQAWENSASLTKALEAMAVRDLQGTLSKIGLVDLLQADDGAVIQEALNEIADKDKGETVHPLTQERDK